MNKNGMLPDNTFENKVILITGGATGLGRSIGEYLLKLGGKIIITSRRETVINSVSEELNKEYNNKVFGISGDVRNNVDVENVISKGIEHFGKIDMLINYFACIFFSPT